MVTENEMERNALGKTEDFPFIDGAGEIPTASEDDTPAKDATSRPARSAARSSGILAIFGNNAFPYLLLSSVIQLSVYLNKLYQDSSAVGTYFEKRDLKCTLISAFCLFLPALIYIFYVVCAYLKEQGEAETKEVGTRVVHGFLLVPWQIKGRVELLQFSAQRICQRRPLNPNELEEKCLLERQAAVLEFFEEFYAGFTQLLLQLFIIMKSLDGDTADETLYGEVVASILTLIAMLIAVRRRDDGPLTSVLSLLGWSCVIASRCACVAMAATVLMGWTVPLLMAHALAVTAWVFAMAVESHRKAQSAPLSGRRMTSLFLLVLTVFGLPSLVYWPIMFQLKERGRPLIFLLLLMLENAGLLALWVLSDKSHADHRVLLFVIAGVFVAGCVFLLGYICCKPKYTDQVVYHDMKETEADMFGIYFEFCDVVFRIDRRKDVEERLKEIRARHHQT